MPFDRGSITFSMFDLAGDIPEDFAAMFASAKAGTLDSVTAEPQLGWVTGRHLLDTAIDEASAQIGGSYYLTLRQAQRKIPASLLNALCRREEQSFLAANPGMTQAQLYAFDWANAPLKIVAVGTTAGTGSEAAPYAVLTLPGGQKKKTFKI